jgi:xanthine dehydrogenase accessory factor
MSKNKRSSPVDKHALVLVRGGGDLATGVALRLHRAGIQVIITEIAQPLAVRRAVSFAEAVYEGQHTVEGVTARLVHTAALRRATPVEREQLATVLEADEIPVLIDPNADILTDLQILIVVDARLLKQPPAPLPASVPLHIGLGPGFHAGIDCHAVIETRRSHTLGRVYWTGTTQPDSGEPEGDPRRVLRAPSDGMLAASKQIGDHCEKGDVIAVIHPVILGEPFPGDRHLHRHQVQVRIPPRSGETLRGVDPEQGRRAQSDMKIHSPFAGVLRGLIRDGIQLTKGLKIGDVDPRDNASACFLVSDKSLAIGGAVLEAILMKEEIRQELWK